VGQHAEALVGFENAVQRYPENPALHLEFAVALLLAIQAEEATAGQPDEAKMQILRQALRAQLLEAYERLNRKTPPEVTKNVFKSLTFHWLYEYSPRGFTEAIRYGEEYVNDPRQLPSGGIWVNVACAYGQKTRWLMEESGQPAPDPVLRDRVKQAIEQALRLDETWNLRFQLLLRKDDPRKLGQEKAAYVEENDLECYEADQEIRILIGLPPDVRPAAPGASSSSSISVPAASSGSSAG